MSKQKSTNTTKMTPCILYNRGIELLNCGPTLSTGFSIADFKAEELYDEVTARFNYIFVVLKGKINLSCKLFTNVTIGTRQMVFVPKDSFFKIRTIEHAEIMCFAFTTTIIRTDKEALKYFCKNARKFKNTSCVLNLCHEMQQVVDMISQQILSGKIESPNICEAWNTLFFHTVQIFYEPLKVVAFLRPLYNSAINFEFFIENNYMESAGNVSYLIELSGIPAARFHSLFAEKFGMTAKAWLDKKAKNRIQLMASSENITVSEMAKVFNVSTQRFCGLCRRLFDCTPRELIARKQLENRATKE